MNLFRRLAPVLCVVFVCLSVCSSAMAQANSCKRSIWIVWLNYFPPYPGLDCGPDGGNGGVGGAICWQATGACPPPAAADETGCGCVGSHGSGGGSSSGGGASPGGGASCGNSINVANGNTLIQQGDLTLPGLGGGLAFTRTWNSRWPSSQSAFSSGRFGPNWRSTYEERVFLGSDGFMKYSRADGSFWSFASNSGAPGFQIAAPANGGATMAIDNPATTWTITFSNGEKRLFTYTSGSLQAIVDRNGNTTQFLYDGLNRLVTVTDPASRHLYFGFNNQANPNLVTAITSDFGISLSYNYNSAGLLASVVKQDGSTVQFSYDDQSRIITVSDGQAKILESYTYDSAGRGLTSARANGVDAVTVSYSQ